VAAQSIEQRGGIVVVASLDDAFALANAYAPEHLCLLLKDPWQYVGKSARRRDFLGERSFEVLGDLTWPAHRISCPPADGALRLAVERGRFPQLISLIGLNETALQRIGPAAARLAESEGLTPTPPPSGTP